MAQKFENNPSSRFGAQPQRHSRKARAPGHDGDGLTWSVSPATLREEVLSLSERADLLDALHDAVIVRNLAGRILLWNQAAQETYGHSRQQALEANYDVLLRPQYTQPLADVHMRLLHTDGWEGRIIHRHADGQEVIVSSRWRLWRGDQSMPVGILEVNRDISHQVQAESRAEIERQRLASLLNMLPAYVAIKDEDCRIRFANRQFTEVFGKADAGPCHQVQFGRSKRCEHCHALEVLNSQQGAQWENRQIDGRVFRVWGYPFPDASGRPMVLELGVDVTELRRAQELVAEISEHERRALGLDLHDSLGQRIAGLGFLVQAMMAKTDQLGDEPQQIGEQIVELSQQITSQVRAMAHGLDPVSLEDEGLGGGLSDLAETVETIWDIPVEVECDSLASLRGQTALQLYRIAQEACSNAARHARCSRIRISLTRRQNEAVMQVSDDGLGLGPEPDVHRGMGIRTMKYRAGTLAGDVELSACAEGGTCVTCRVPIPAEFGV